jgi:hypothetical protein
MKSLPSRFIRRTLMQDETIRHEAKFHRIYLVSALMSFLIAAACGYGITFLLARFGIKQTFIPLYVGVAIGAWYALCVCMHIWTMEIVLTDRRIIYKRGFFQIRADEVDIEQLASDYVDQSFLGRLLNYGAIHIRCVQADDIYLPPIRNPYEFRNALERGKQEYREKYNNTGRLYRHGPEPQGGQP